ncbi:MAG: hypothetical protein ACR2NU_08950 [Aeoliella sp.]
MTEDSFNLTHRRAVIHLSASDEVWVASMRLAHARWNTKRFEKPQLECHAPEFELSFDLEHKASRMLLKEVGRHGLREVAKWLAETKQREFPAATLLTRVGAGAITSREDRCAAATLLHEAGSCLTIASPRQLPRILEAAEHFFAPYAADDLDPLDALPLASWGPGWQLGLRRDRVC